MGNQNRPQKGPKPNYYFARSSRYNDPTFYEKNFPLHNPFKRKNSSGLHILTLNPHKWEAKTSSKFTFFSDFFPRIILMFTHVIDFEMTEMAEIMYLKKDFFGSIARFKRNFLFLQLS